MKWIRAIFKLLSFMAFYVKALVLSNLRIAWDVITPGMRIRLGFIGIPLLTTNDREILVFANLVTMTPGTLSLEVSQDRKILYVHVMYLRENLEETRAELGITLQTKVLEVLRAWK